MSLKTALLSSTADARVLRLTAHLFRQWQHQERMRLADAAVAAHFSTGAETSPDAPGPAGAADSRDTAE